MNAAAPSSPVSWHALDAAEALARLDSRAEGLSAAEAAARLERWGPNALEMVPPASAWRILVDQLASVVVALLFVAALLAWLLGDRLEAGAIVAVLAINTLIGFLVELRARRAMEALLSLDVPQATALRDGEPQEIDARDLVPGDVIVAESGEAVPADCLLLEAVELRMNEAPLTGESAPVGKRAGISLEAATPVADRENLIYKATAVVNGHAHGLVVATGVETEVGRIGRLASGLGDEKTPLEVRLDILGRRLIALTLGIAALVVALGLLRGFAIVSMIEAGIALAIAAVPEGLPAVATITLGLGLRRMARRNALIRRLPAVEALGSATTICTDKTGTLTAGEMVVTRIWLPDADVHVTGEGYGPEGGFAVDGQSLDPHSLDNLLMALRIGVLVNRARVERDEDDGWSLFGDPTEAALIVAGRKAGLERDVLLETFEEIDVVPFSSERRYMATVHRCADGRTMVFVKGDPTGIIDRCNRIMTGGGESPLDDDGRRDLHHANDRLAAAGLRVLAVAYADGTDAAGQLTFVGLTGMIDPPVPGVMDTIRRFQRAGIRTVMITGDQRPTAEAIARQLGVLREGDRTLDGRELAAITERDLVATAGHVGAFSRVSPEDKLRIVSALQAGGEIVAMLGDGVNDAAALRKAAIGVAMGERGTDVAREASDVVLTDDRFETIGAAIEEGRVIWDNIRKFVFYLFSCNLAEVLVLMLAMLVGLPLPLLPLQILWLNLITDTFPAFALAMEPADPDLMERPPRDPQAALMSREFTGRVALHASMITASTLAAYVLGLRMDPSRAVTMCFMTLAFAQIMHLGNARSRDPVLVRERVFTNRWAIGAVMLTVGLQVATVMLPPLRLVLDTVTLPARDWLIVVGLSLVPAVVGQVTLLVRRGMGISPG